MNVEKRLVTDLVHADYNPRKKLTPKDAEYKKIKRSLEEFGYVDPIIINSDNTIIGGHQRATVLQDLGYTEIDVVVVDMDKPKEKALNVALNKISGEWDFEKLEVLLEEIQMDMDATITGFEDEDIQRMLAELHSGNEAAEEDDYNVDANFTDEPNSKPGDIYMLGNHRLMCGDSTSIADVEKLLDGEKADMVLTDPPYGISIVGDNGKIGAGKLAQNNTYMPVKGDETTETTKAFYNTCVELGLDRFILFGGNYFADFLPFSDSWLIWDKRGDMTSNNFADGEMAWCSFHTPVRIYKQVWNGMIREGEKEKRVHPTQKPIKILAGILSDFSNENDIVLDCFGGSGSTLIACEQLNRTCYMMEYEPHYIDVIINRWEQFTGQKAIKIA